MAIEVSARIGALICQVAAALGASASALAASAGFDPARAVNPDAYVPITVIDALWDAAAAATADPSFGLHAAEQLRPGMMDVLDYAVRTAPTVRVAFERLVRYDRLVRDVGALTLVDDGAITRVAYAAHPGGATSRHAIECKLAALVVIAAQMSGRSLRPRVVSFRHAAPSDTSEHARVFGVAPRFGAERDALDVDRDALDAPCPGADPILWRVLERHVDALLAQRPTSSLTAERVDRHLARTLANGDATLAATARAFGMSERSLQRRLSDEHTSFQAVLDDLRRRLAARYLGDPAISIAEISYLLGYSEPSAFHRAFKRWTGSTPADARAGGAT